MKRLIVLIAFVSCFFACKKEKVNEETPTSQISNVADPARRYGELNTTKTEFFAFISTNPIACLDTTISVAALFSFQPFENGRIVSGTDVSAGTVTANGTTLKFKNTSIPKHYSDTTNTINSPVQNWTVSGSNTVPQMNYTVNDSFPVYQGYLDIPDTVYLSQGFTLPINGLQGCNEIKFFVSTLSKTLTKNLNMPVTEIVVTPAELNGFTGSSLFMQIWFTKANYENVAGKTYQFRTALELRVNGIALLP
ncbi:MAG: hypothetical protein Q8M29_02455 [Bacteroidota bacterium]|nr:hypothetical protein [Bacteroidota bacterium]